MLWDTRRRDRVQHPRSSGIVHCVIGWYSLNNLEIKFYHNNSSIKFPPQKLLHNQCMSRYPHTVPPSTSAIMAVRRHPTSLMVLPTGVQIEIACHLAMTLEQPMDDLRSLWAMLSSMCRICGDPIVDQRVAVDRCRHGVRLSNDRVNYFTLLARLTQVSNYWWSLTTIINHQPNMNEDINQSPT
jgi:hypothetical protein